VLPKVANGKAFPKQERFLRIVFFLVAHAARMGKSVPISQGALPLLLTVGGAALQPS
jgi:hypothetical protein